MTDAPERALGMAPNPFDEDMKGIADLTRSMFELEQEFDDDGTLRLSELEKVLHLDKWLLQKRADAKHGVDQVRDEIRELSRIARQQKEAATRPASVPSAEEAHARLAAIHAAKLVDLKFTTDEERNLNRLRGELERLKAELKVEEDEEVWQESELNSEVLRLKMYRDFGFTPVEDADGTYNKVLVRSSKTLSAQTIELEPKKGNFFYANLLWSMLD